MTSCRYCRRLFLDHVHLKFLYVLLARMLLKDSVLIMTLKGFMLIARPPKANSSSFVYSSTGHNATTFFSTGLFIYFGAAATSAVVVTSKVLLSKRLYGF